MATAASNAVWDNNGALAIAACQVQLVRDAGALAELPLHLSALGMASAWTGDFAGAASNVAEAESVAAAIGSVVAPWASLRLLALRGREAEATAAIASMFEHASAGAQGMATYAHWAAAVLYNGLARHEEAASAAQATTSKTAERFASMWALPELVEGAVRAGDTELARHVLERALATRGRDPGAASRGRCAGSTQPTPDTDLGRPSLPHRTVQAAVPAAAPAAAGVAENPARRHAADGPPGRRIPGYRLVRSGQRASSSRVTGAGHGGPGIEDELLRRLHRGRRIAGRALAVEL